MKLSDMIPTSTQYEFGTAYLTFMSKWALRKTQIDWPMRLMWNTQLMASRRRNF